METLRDMQTNRKKILIIGIIIGLFVSPLVLLNYLLTANSTPIIVFDFDNGQPNLTAKQDTPLHQTVNNVTMFISSPSDNKSPAFSIQNYETTFVHLTQFSGNYLFDNQPTADTLILRFDQNLRSIKLTFATVEYRGGEDTNPSKISLTVYEDSENPALIRESTAKGVFEKDAYPQGTLTFESTTPFNVVKIELTDQGPNAAKDFYIDNINVQLYR